MSVTAKAVIETKNVYTCDVHGTVQSETCPFCDKCPHGITRHGHCDHCNDFDWMNAPVNRAEFEDILKTYNRCYSGTTRRSPYPRQYVVVDVLGKLLLEFKQLKGW